MEKLLRMVQSQADVLITHKTANEVCSPFGKEFRSLFYSPSDMVMCGIDFSGLELRVLGHYLHNYDNGNFSKTLLEDDIHTINQKATGLATRSQAKTFIYAYLYSCGDKKLGEILGVTLEEAKRVRARFNKSLPAVPMLNEAVKQKFRNTGYLNGLDGRRLICRAEYSSLNTLIQSAGALLVKQGTIILNEELYKAGFRFGEHYAMVLHIHDEMQFIVKKEKLEEFKIIATSNSCVVLGDMLELGDTSKKEHEEIILKCLQNKIQNIHLVGPHFLDTNNLDSTITKHKDVRTFLKFMKSSSLNFEVFILLNPSITLFVYCRYI